MLKDHIVMLREFFREFKSTGTLCSSGPHAARALASPVIGSRPPMNILEVGPGTGPVTKVILDYLQEGDSLTLCEINPRLMAQLKVNVKENPQYLKHKDRIHFFEGPVQEMGEEMKFDVFVCAIPFLNLDVAVVEEIFSKLLRIAKPNAVMTYFEYIGLRKLGKMIPLKDRQERLRAIERYMNTEARPRMFDLNRVWLNVLPINIYKLRMAA